MGAIYQIPLTCEQTLSSARVAEISSSSGGVSNLLLLPDLILHLEISFESMHTSADEIIYDFMLLFFTSQCQFRVGEPVVVKYELSLPARGYTLSSLHEPHGNEAGAET